MSINDPEVASLYGALDSTTFADGEAFTAHVLRVLAMSGNRLVTKGQPLFNLVWPTRALIPDLDPFTGGGADGGGFTGIAWPRWIKCLHSIPVPKKPGLNKAQLRLRARITTDESILIQMASVARPFNPSISTSADNVITMLGTGAMADYGLDDIPISSGSFEVIEFYVRASPSTTILGDTATYGDPNEGAIVTLQSTAVGAVASGNTWNESAGSADAWDEGGHLVEFVDSADQRVVTPRVITLVNDATPDPPGPGLHFQPPLTQDEMSLARSAGFFRILRLPKFNIANIAVAAQPLEVT